MLQTQREADVVPRGAMTEGTSSPYSITHPLQAGCGVVRVIICHAMLFTPTQDGGKCNTLGENVWSICR